MKSGWFLASAFCLRALAAGPEFTVADAAKRGDAVAVQKLIASHADVNLATSDGSTALHWAAYHEDLATVRALLRAGANPKTANRYGVTPLSLACINGNGAIVESLLQSGADANAALPGGETPLMTAARTGKVDAVNALLKHGAVVDTKVGDQTALMWAASEGNAGAIEVLVHAGADIHARTKSGFSPLLFAVRDGRIEAMRTLLKLGASVNEKIENKRVPGASPSQAGPGPTNGTSALSLATGSGHFELASLLLDAGADPNAAEQGWAPIHAITWVRKPGGGDNDPPPYGSGNMTSLEFLKKLVAKSADINAKVGRNIKPGLTAIHTAGATTFFLAARGADSELMRALVKLGADPSIPNSEKTTPLIAAAGLGTRSPGEDAGTEEEVIEAMKLAIELGNDPNAVNANGETAMHGAAYKNLPGAVEYLASHGALIEIWNRKNKYGWTPLAIAEGYRFGNFKPSFDTIAAFHRVMEKAGVPAVTAPEEHVNR